MAFLIDKTSMGQITYQRAYARELGGEHCCELTRLKILKQDTPARTSKEQTENPEQLKRPVGGSRRGRM